MSSEAGFAQHAIDSLNVRSRVEGNAIVNALTIDVEDYFQVSALAPQIDRATWDTRRAGSSATSGACSSCSAATAPRPRSSRSAGSRERYPQLVRAIVAARARDGEPRLCVTSVQRTSAQSSFEQDVRRAKALLEDIGGQPVQRLPGAELFDRTAPIPGPSTCWSKTGLRYSSSVYPVRHDHYGMPDAPRFPYQTRPQGCWRSR